jgi:hypothetical protein
MSGNPNFRLVENTAAEMGWWRAGGISSVQEHNAQDG